MFASYVALFVSALLAGAVNSVAGGGTLLTFPTLLSMGVTPLAANATSAIALIPGSFGAFWGYRRSLVGSRRTLLEFGVPSVVGGAIGALLASRVGDARFRAIVPWLIFGATALFVAQGPIRAWLWKRSGEARTPETTPAIAMFFQLAVAIYGGFFGAGIGILMLATLGLLGFTDIHRMNGVKNFAAVCINLAATITFVRLGLVRWPLALIMAAGAIVGGYSGAGIAKRVGERNVRRMVVAVGVTIGVVMVVRR